MRKRFYISGAISKDPDYYEKFKATAEWISAHGGTYYNPAEQSKVMPEASWGAYMSFCCAGMKMCDAMVLLSGGEYSAGAQIELYWAKDWGLPIYLDDTKGESDDFKKTLRYLQTHVMSFAMLSSARLAEGPEEEGATEC